MTKASTIGNLKHFSVIITLRIINQYHSKKKKILNYIFSSSDALTAYLAEGGSQDKLERPLVFCPELGLTIEQLRDGFTLDSLWQVLPPETNKKSLQMD